MKQPLLQSASAAERLRTYLLRQAWFHSALAALPRQLRWSLRKMYLAPVDLADRLLGRHDPGLPSKAHIFTGRDLDYTVSGRRTLQVMCSVTDVNPSSHILDVGSGMGRLAIVMPDFLDANGRYEGIDIVPEGIEWCKQHIVGPHDNIHFTLADVYNKEYNPKGSRQPADYQFPYEDESFDVAVLLRFSRTCCHSTLTDISLRSRVYSKEWADLRILLHYHAGIAPANDFRSQLDAFQTQPRVTLDPKQEGPRAQHRL